MVDFGQNFKHVINKAQVGRGVEFLDEKQLVSWINLKSKWSPGGDFTGPEGSQCFQCGPMACS